MVGIGVEVAEDLREERHELLEQQNRKLGVFPLLARATLGRRDGAVLLQLLPRHVRVLAVAAGRAAALAPVGERVGVVAVVIVVVVVIAERARLVAVALAGGGERVGLLL